MGVLEVLQGTEAEEVSMESQASVSSILPDEPEPETAGQTETAEAFEAAVICTSAAEHGLVGRFSERCSVCRQSFQSIYRDRRLQQRSGSSGG